MTWLLLAPLVVKGTYSTYRSPPRSLANSYSVVRRGDRIGSHRIDGSQSSPLPPPSSSSSSFTTSTTSPPPSSPSSSLPPPSSSLPAQSSSSHFHRHHHHHHRHHRYHHHRHAMSSCTSFQFLSSLFPYYPFCWYPH